MSKSPSNMADIYAALAKKYNHDAFMYVEYPHKSFWSEKFNERDFKAGLRSLFLKDKNAPLMLYVHIPYCKRQCFYCTCHTMITNDYERIKNYLNLLFLEIDLFRKFFEENSIIPNFTEVHLGGGSPTILQEKEFGQLIEKLQSIVDIKKLSEFSIEIDPREVNIEKIKFYHSRGIDRLSFGIQDFDLDVQKAINRVQPPELIEKLLTPEVRKLFKKGINFDIICGLPLQSRESIRRTFEKIVKISPDRICFNYLHFSPKFAKHQMIMFDGRDGRPSEVPNLYTRKMLFTEVLNILVSSGYVRTGYDHFAKPDDEVAKAMRNKTMRWNALGVTAGRYSDVIGIGPHSYSTIGNYYSQNVYELPVYEAAVTKGRFPIYRGYKLNKDDMIRREVIQALRNFFFIDFKDIEKKYDIDFRKYFKKEIISLAEFVKDGIAELSDEKITITELGQQFTNVVCMNFDAYLEKTPSKF